MPHAASTASPGALSGVWSSALARAVDSGDLAAVVGPTAPVRADLAAAAHRYARPLQIAVCGRPGTGRDTVARALRERLSVTAIGPGEAGEEAADADLWLLVLSGLPRRDDHAILATLPRDRTIVVLGKADTHGLGDPTHADDIAADCAERIGLPVQPVSALLACADLSDDETDFLRRLAAAGETMPSMSAQFLTGGADRPETLGDERTVRAGLLRRIDQRGIDIALALLAEGDESTAATVNRELHAESGIHALVPTIRDRVDIVRYWRLVELRTRVELLAARGADRDALEHLLQIGEVA
ncbi:hypothetical protein [Gordonia sp. OPL2]|uniref:hypothetical protein n=1 Tax=Gordonia sp. OPL2 TaxID=2486274 RepID=UPI001654F82F|nr:hypothetical protein [Gordonia sp. OPL2]ROZ99108.1 hypothetical protein EEB19_13255 [Gordonia sp. OPL2]